MLLQSHAGEIHLLPALPSAWPAGSVRGPARARRLRGRLAWQDGALTEARFHSANGSEGGWYRDWTAPIALKAGASARWDGVSPRTG